MLPDMTGFRALYGPGTTAVCAYGGDGTLVRAWRSIDYDEALFPVRNYGLCPEHEKYPQLSRCAVMPFAVSGRTIYCIAGLNRLPQD